MVAKMFRRSIQILLFYVKTFSIFGKLLEAVILTFSTNRKITFQILEYGAQNNNSSFWILDKNISFVDKIHNSGSNIAPLILHYLPEVLEELVDNT